MACEWQVWHTHFTSLHNVLKDCLSLVRLVPAATLPFLSAPQGTRHVGVWSTHDLSTEVNCGYLLAPFDTHWNRVRLMMCLGCSLNRSVILNAPWRLDCNSTIYTHWVCKKTCGYPLDLMKSLYDTYYRDVTTFSRFAGQIFHWKSWIRPYTSNIFFIFG